MALHQVAKVRQVTPDPFDTAALRSRVLDAWAASPARFREDANAEEDLARGGHRDRLIIELAQNAADAAARAGVPGRLLLRLEPGRGAGSLLAANTGAPLDSAGVAALSTLRASAKRADTDAVGRFGVGFAAVLSVTDEPRMHSRAGTVRWSAEQTRQACAGVPSLRAELDARDGVVPVLRLPLAATGSPPQGYDTAVVLPLRDAAAAAVVRRLLEGVDATLALALPGLAEVEIDLDGRVRTLRATHGPHEVVVDEDGVRTRWAVVRETGALRPELFADRPVEERWRPWWSVTWALPTEGPAEGWPQLPRVLYAPTPTDEPCALPALLIASFPLDPTRRHVAPGALTDALVAHAATAYAGLAGVVTDPVALIPGPVPVGALDARLRRAVLEVLARTPLLVTVADAGVRLRPRDAVTVEGAGPVLLEVLAAVLEGLVPDRGRGLADVGVRRLPLADVVDSLAGLRREPGWWRSLYVALASDPAASRDSLGALPVPLADGRVVTGPRSALVLRDGEDLTGALRVLGLRVVHAEAAHPLLLRLGATEATARTVLEHPAVRAAVERSMDPEADLAEVEELVMAVLALVESARPDPDELPWLDRLALPDTDGGWEHAGELLLPDAPLRAVLDPDALGVVAPRMVARWGEEVLVSAGVLRGFALVHDSEVVVDPYAVEHDLDGEGEWMQSVQDEVAALAPARPRPRAASDLDAVPAVLPEFVAVRDLDLVRPDAWPQALSLLAVPGAREAVAGPQRVVLPGGGSLDVRSYTAWWLARHPVLGGRRPVDLRDPAGDAALAGLWDDAPAELDPVLARALGVRTTLQALFAAPGGADELLDRLADPDRPVTAGGLRALWSALAGQDPDEVTPPQRIRVTPGRVVPADEVAVLDAPDLLPLLGELEPLIVSSALAGGLADVLDLPMASELVAGEVISSGQPREVPAVVARALAWTPRSYVQHERLVARGRSGDVEVGWRVLFGDADGAAGAAGADGAEGADGADGADGAAGAAGAAGADGADAPQVHAAHPDGLARALAWAAGAWERRWLVAALLAEPGRADMLLAEAELDGAAAQPGVPGRVGRTDGGLRC